MEREPRSGRLERAARWALPCILLVSLTTRVRGVPFGFPLAVHPDEPAIIDAALQMLRTGDLNPHFFSYPSLMIYLQAAAQGLQYLTGATLGHFESVADMTVPTVYRVGRLLTVSLSVATVAAVFAVARGLFGTTAGLVAALLLATSSLHAAHGFLITVDEPMVLWVVLSLLPATRILQGSSRLRDYALGGVCVGLAAGTKYTGVCCLAPLLAAQVAGHGWRSLFSRDVAALGGLAVASFLLTTPFAALDPSGFVEGVRREARHYASGHPGYENSATSFGFHLSALWRGMGPLAVTLALAAAGAMALFDRKRLAVVAAFPLLYFLFVGSYPVRFERNALALLPFVAIAAGWAVSKIVESPRRPALLAALFISIVLGNASFQALASWRHAEEVTLPDTRVLAKLWIEQNLPAGSRVGREHYTPPLDRSRFEVTDLGYFGLSEVSPAPFDYLVASSDDYARFLASPTRYPDRAAAYQALFDRCDLVAEFLPTPHTTTGPTIRVLSPR